MVFFEWSSLFHIHAMVWCSTHMKDSLRCIFEEFEQKIYEKNQKYDIFVFFTTKIENPHEYQFCRYLRKLWGFSILVLKNKKISYFWFFFMYFFSNSSNIYLKLSFMCVLHQTIACIWNKDDQPKKTIFLPFLGNNDQKSHFYSQIWSKISFWGWYHVMTIMPDRKHTHK